MVWVYSEVSGPHTALVVIGVVLALVLGSWRITPSSIAQKRRSPV